MFHTGRHWPVLYCTDLGGVGTYLAAANYVPQVINLSHTELTLTQFCIQYVLMEAVKDTSEMMLMLIIASTVY